MGPPKDSCLLLGPRRSGKTTVLRQLFPQFQYVTMDDLDDLDFGQRDPKGFAQRLVPAAIIHEIQRVPALTVAIKKLVDEGRLTAYMSGSSSIGLMDSTADTLAGRIDILHLPTACWGEEEGPPRHSLLADRVALPELREGSRRVDQALRFGGFPEVLTQQTDPDRLQLLKRYRDTYFTRDLAHLSHLENQDALLAILHHLGRSTGSHLDVSNYAREAGISFPTTKKYLDALHQAGLIFKLYPYQFGAAKRFVRAAKLYFADTGVLTALGVAVSDGQRVENFVLAEIEKRRKLGMIDATHLCFYKSAAGSEVDLIIEKPDEVIAIEVKASRTIAPKDTRNLRAFIKSGVAERPVRAFVFYMGDEYVDVYGGVTGIPVSAIWRARL